MRKWWFLLATLVLWIILGYALAQGQRTDPAPQQRDTSGDLRIVSMAPNLTEVLCALELEDALVGVTTDSDYPPAAAAKPTVGTFWQPNIEAIIALKPDLVVTLGFQQQKSLVDRLQRMGYPCLVTDVWKVRDLFSAIATIGQATARDRQAEALIANIQAKTQHLQETMEGKVRPRVLWVVQREPLRVAGRDTFINELIELAGGENAIGPTLHKYPPIGAEQVIACGAQVIIEPTMVESDRDQQLERALAYWNRLPLVPAVADGRIYVIDGDLVSRLSPRLYQGIETIAGCLRPEIRGE